MDSSQIPQGMVGLVAAASSPSSSTAKPQHHPPPPEERRPQKTPKEQPLSCPRCNSTNTKFCYYNNYSLSQPRHFCKSCKRYWTHGGSLRNVPIGGGSRKNKRAPSSTLPSPPPPKRLFLSDPMTPPLQNPNLNLNPNPTFVGMGGLFHAGVPLSPFVSLNSIGGHSQNMQDGGDCYGFWINGAMGGSGVGDAFGGGGT